MRGARVVLQPRPGVQSSEKSQTSARIRVWSVQVAGDVTGREAALVRHHLMQGDVALAALRKLGR